MKFFWQKRVEEPERIEVLEPRKLTGIEKMEVEWRFQEAKANQEKWLAEIEDVKTRLGPEYWAKYGPSIQQIRMVTSVYSPYCYYPGALAQMQAQQNAQYQNIGGSYLFGGLLGGAGYL